RVDWFGHVDTSRDVGYVMCMPAGRSNRIVIDVDDVELKRRMYSVLAEDGRSLKEWFVAAATDYLETRVYARQLPLPVLRAAEPVATYGVAGAAPAASALKPTASRKERATARPRTRRRSRS
ncbi:MAG: hypothetical protein ACRD2A_14635, partial [Vicinamibacterales bacterium]